MDLLADHNLPFAVALGAILLLSLMQIIGLSDLFSADIDADLDAGAAFDGSTSLMGSITTLLGIGRVPFLVWLMVFLLLFAAIGLGIQELAASLTGGPLYSWLAALFSAGATLPVTAVLVRPLGRIMPQDETDAVDVGTLVGRRAVITIGRAATGSPARARVLDFHGTTHHVMVEPHEAGAEITEGEEVLLVRREGQLFYAMPLAERRLSPLD
jgi:hypothetical protein